MRSSSGVPDCRSPRNGTAAAETPFSRHHGDVVDPPAGEAECLVAHYSFGGWKASLFGDTHAHGTEGIQFFTRGKAITSRWLDPSHGGINLGFPENN